VRCSGKDSEALKKYNVKEEQVLKKSEASGTIPLGKCRCSIRLSQALDIELIVVLALDRDPDVVRLAYITILVECSHVLIEQRVD
jgi:hypothetical protein